MRRDTINEIKNSKGTALEQVERMNSTKFKVYKKIDKWIKKIQKKSEPPF